MAEIIVIDDSSEEDEEEKPVTEKSSPNILEMNNLTERLKQHFASCTINDPTDEVGIVQWRMKLNPFRTYDFLHKSNYAFEVFEDTSSLSSDIFSLSHGDVSDDIISCNGDSVVMDEKATHDMEISLKVDDEDVVEVKPVDSNEEDEHSPISVNNNAQSNISQNKNKDLICPKKIILSDDQNLCCLEGATLSVPNKVTNQVEENLEKCDDLKNAQLTPQSSSVNETMNNANEPGNSHSYVEEKEPYKSSEAVELDVKLPYYLKNFMHIVMTVLDSDDKRLFNEHEIECLQKFKQMSDAAKKLYIRLYQRKRDWFRCDKIQYPRIADDLTSSFKELIEFSYMHDENSLVDFDEICNLLTAPETRSLADDIKLKVNKTKNNSKVDLIKLLKKHCQKQRTIFMTKNNSMKSILSKSAKKYIGRCVKVNDEKRFVFTRVILLFCLTSHFEDIMGHNSYGTGILYQMLLSNLGDVKYPSFKLNKQHDIFLNRQQLIDYAYAVELENDFEVAVEKKDYNSAMKCYVKVRPQLLLVLEALLSLGKNIHCLQLPSFLYCFSKECVTIRLARKCVDVLEKERNYPEAVSLIELLLSQKFMQSSSRGFLWERLILDYERYIKDFGKAYLLSVEALKDPYLRTGHRFNILQRHKRLEKSPKVKTGIKDVLVKSFREEITEPKEETIRTKIFIESSTNNRALFISPGVGDDYKLSNVEHHVITYYQDLGFPSGVHGEGSSVTTLFCLLFWDIIFMDVADVFQSEFQNSPLDIFNDKFYLNREDELNERLNIIYHASEEYLRISIENTWKMNYGTYSVGVNWNLFENEIDAGNLAVCIGKKVLGGICELFCKDLRRRISGFPDLIVWNAEKKTCKIIEVKAPGDKLSVKQIVWLDVLSYLGADAFACYVTGVGGKRKRSSAD